MNKQETDGLIKTRLIELDQVLDDDQEEFIRRSLLLLEEHSSQREIKIMLRSIGGDTIAALGLADLIRSLNSPVTGVVLMANSAACTLLQGCKKRLAYPSAIMWLHSVRPRDAAFEHFEATEHDVEPQLDEYYAAFKKRFCEAKAQHMRLFMNRTGRDEQTVRGWFERGNKSKYMIGACEAKEMGLIDDIVDEHFRIISK